MNLYSAEKESQFLSSITLPALISHHQQTESYPIILKRPNAESLMHAPCCHWLTAMMIRLLEKIGLSVTLSVSYKITDAEREDNSIKVSKTGKELPLVSVTITEMSQTHVLSLLLLCPCVITLYNPRSKLVPRMSQKDGFIINFAMYRRNTRLKEQNSHKAYYNWALPAACRVRLLFQCRLFLVIYSYIASQTKTVSAI